MLRIILAAGAVAFASQVHGATVTLDFLGDEGGGGETNHFAGDICNGGNACGNGDLIDQSFGDVAGKVDVVYDADRDTAALENLRYWSTGYATLTGVAYGAFAGGGLSIELQALAGYSVSLKGFDIAPYLGQARNTSVDIIDLSDSSSVFSQMYEPLPTGGVTSFSFTGSDYTSQAGFAIWLGPDAWDVGIDNVTFEVSETAAPVPLPAAGWLLLAGLGGLAAMRRRASRS